MEEKRYGAGCPEILPPTDDWVFKLLFGNERNKSMVADFLKTFVKLPEEEFELTFLDPHLKPEFEDEKMGIVDVKIKTKSDKIIDIEMQVAEEKSTIGKRVSFYKSKLVTGQIGKGEGYEKIRKVICVLIMDWVLFEKTGEYLHDFIFYDKRNGQGFEEVPEEIYTLELPKARLEERGSGAWNWVFFLKARERKEFEMAAVTNAEIRKAVDELYVISADKEVRAQYELRQKAYRDRLAMKHSAYAEGKEEGIKEGKEEGIKEGIKKGKQEGIKKGKKEGIKEGIKKGKEEGKKEGVLETARKLKRMGMETQEISVATNLSEEEIKSL